jgi:hypothetical protein
MCLFGLIWSHEVDGRDVREHARISFLYLYLFACSDMLSCYFHKNDAKTKSHANLSAYTSGIDVIFLRSPFLFVRASNFLGT